MSSRIASLVGVMVAATTLTATAQVPGRDRIEKEASAQGAQADKLFKADKFEAALKLYRAEAASRKALGDARYEAYALRGVGCCLGAMEDYEPAIEALKAARALDLGRDDPGFAGYDGLLLARCEVRLNRPADAVATLALALPKLDQAVDRDHECDARLLLVTARLALNDPARAAPDAARAAALAREIDDPRRLGDAWHALGRVDVALGKLGPALMRLQDACDSFRESDRPADLADALKDLADLSYRLGRRDRAAAQFEEAAALHARAGDPASEADDRLDLASVRLDLRDPPGAARDAALARDGFLAVDDERSAIEAMVVLAKAQSLAPARDALATSAQTIRDALDRSARAHRDAPADRVRLLLLSADLESRLGRKPDASSRLLEAGKLADASGNPSLRAAVSAATSRLAPKR